MGRAHRSGFGANGRRLQRSVSSERPVEIGSGQRLLVRCVISWAGLVVAHGVDPGLVVELWIAPDLTGFLCCVYLNLHVYFACFVSVIRVVSTHCVLIPWRIRLISICPVKRTLVCPVKRALWIPRMVFVTPMWPELGFGPPFFREFMPLGSLFFSIWYSDTLQEIMFCKRIITIVGEFGP